MRLPTAASDLAEIVRALDAEGIRIADLQLHQPSLDDVFLAKTGRTLEGARRGASAASAAEAAVARERPQPLDQVGVLARRSVLRTLRQPAARRSALVFPLLLLAVNASGLGAATKIPGFPTDSYLDFALAVPFIQGALFVADHRRHRPRAATSSPASSTASR